MTNFSNPFACQAVRKAKGLATITEMAAIVGCSRASLQAMADKGLLPRPAMASASGSYRLWKLSDAGKVRAALESKEDRRSKPWEMPAMTPAQASVARSASGFFRLLDGARAGND